MRLVLILAAAAFVGWVALDRDSGARERLAAVWDDVRGMFGADTAPAPGPNWGDVAERVGDFAKEEKGLREVLRPAAAPADGAAAPVDH